MTVALPEAAREDEITSLDIVGRDESWDK